MQLIMSITPYTVISIENLLFGSDNLTDENNLIVFRNVQKYIHILIDLNDTKLYPVLRMLSFICTQSPYPPLPFFPITSVYQIYSCIHLLYCVTCCHFPIYVYNIFV
jgi:hypothetical protein